ncbi:MAG: tRNA (adenosine(37)-N6)-dimethylallyltransferase MiaA [Azospirillum brasilense]|nr:MAG: tRNA (adenosine(37)-N6)-dimethylallyltransferase MiaA [Azospirillum brasilense]
MNQTIGVLMGPTGTGKSAMALRVAQQRPTVIINADAMQMVAELRVLTARPTVQEEAQAPHALYGVLPAAEPTSVARWLALVRPVIAQAWAEGQYPLLVGGTGMYINALRHGLADMPPVPEHVRAQVRAMDSAALYAALQAEAPESAAHYKPGDTQRLARALEVWRATGQTLQHWQAQRTAPLFPQATFHVAYLNLPRAVLYARLDARFEQMMLQGALDEVRALMALELPADTPVLRAHGAPELAAYLQGSMTREDAVAKAQQNTRNYAKRQMTWLRHQAADAQALSPTDHPAIFL